MTDKQTYWLYDGGTEYALASGAEERDRWRGQGWVDADEPTEDGFVWARQDGIEKPGRFPVAAFRAAWSQMGWEPGLPEEPESPINGVREAAAAERAAAKREAAADKAAAKTPAAKADSKSSKSTAGTGDDKE